jgi:hypothetical protein
MRNIKGLAMSSCVAISFGFWQNNYYAAAFMFTLLLFVCAIFDEYK